MLMRSTGLGKTQLQGNITEIKRMGDYLIMYVEVTDPVRWKLRVGLTFGDIMKVIKSCANKGALGFLLSPKQWKNKDPQHPGDF